MDPGAQEMAHKAFRRAVAIVGSQSAFATLIGTSQQNVSKLLKRGSVLPFRFVGTVEPATGISRHDLRPDIYPPELSPSTGSQAGDEGGMAPAAVGLPAAGAASAAPALSVESPRT